MGIGGLVPLPSDALVTPVTFRVRKRNLRGIFSEFDALEDGSRELSGEWVVGKKLWQKLQAEWRNGNGQKSSTNPGYKKKRKEQVILYLHGGMLVPSHMYCYNYRLILSIPGAYYISSAAAQRLLTIPLSKYTEARVFGEYSQLSHWSD